jgi:hypothetical protein
LAPTFDALLAFSVRALGVHGDRKRNARSRAAVRTAVMWQPSIPDHEVTRPHWDLDGFMLSEVYGDVDDWTRMRVQVPIQFLKNGRHALEGSLTGASVRQIEHPLI